MKIAFFAVLLVLAACAPPQASRSPASRATGAPAATPQNRSATPDAPTTAESKSAPNTVSQDAAECERQVAVSAGAGSRAQAFNDCMRARGRVPGR